MPEGPELRIMSDFINEKVGHRSVAKVEKSPLYKKECDFSRLQGKEWNIKSVPRGKEMILVFSHVDQQTGEKEEHYLKLGFGKIGSIVLYDLDHGDELFDRRAMLRLYFSDKILVLSDYTRLSIWRWAPGWDPYRSPDIVTQHNDWRDYLYRNRNHKHFKKPIFTIMTDQRFFNGLGNITRSEILARMRFSPFTPFVEVLESDLMRTEFFQTSRDVLIELYNLGGFQSKYWKNPYGKLDKKFHNWVRCYNKPLNAYFIKDENKGKFWFSKKWSLDYAKWVDDHDVQDTTLQKKIYSKNK